MLKDDLKRLNKDIKEYTEQLEQICKQFNLPRAYNREQVESLTYDLGINKEEWENATKIKQSRENARLHT